MEVHVTPLKSKGQTKQKWLRAMGNAVGTLRIRDKRDTVNLRSTRVAELFNHRPVRAEGEKWILFDVQLVWAKGAVPAVRLRAPRPVERRHYGLRPELARQRAGAGNVGRDRPRHRRGTKTDADRRPGCRQPTHLTNNEYI